MKKKKRFLCAVKDSFAKIILGNKVLNKGEKVWASLDRQLPKAQGALLNDKPRVEQFAQKIKELNFIDYYALRCWLDHEIWELKRYPAEITSAKTEEIEARYLQIYTQHRETME